MASPQVLVSPLLGVVFDKLTSLIQNKFGVQEQMQKLSEKIDSILQVLTDAEEKQATDTRIQDWLKKLKDAAYKAEDVLEEWAFPDQQLAPERVTDSLKELKESFHKLAEDTVKFQLRRGMVQQKRADPSLDRETGAAVIGKVWGRGEDKEKLVKLLLDQCRHQERHPTTDHKKKKRDQGNSQEDIFVCSIWGMGGLGKTTLAQMVYNDDRVAEHFQSRAWVCVSDNFEVTRVLKLFIDYVSRNSCNLETLASLQHCLQKELLNQRFLLVLDDVWDDNPDKWEILKGSLACGAKGGCVIVTTRDNEVASIAGGTCSPYYLKALSFEDCWSLFKQRAFGFKNKETRALVTIGREIVAKCGGIPLAAKALGGLLRQEDKESVWLSIKDNEIWKLPQDSKNNIIPILKLSYSYLMSPLKQCFAYCSIFPKDHLIHRKDLIDLWMANGFVQADGNIDLEDRGDRVFYALLSRSFFQDTKEDEDGNVLTCKMHDLVHDLACSMADNECSALDIGRARADGGSAGDVTKRTRHVSLVSRQQPSSFSPGSIQTSSPYLRSLIWLEYDKLTRENSVSIFSGLKCLRALDLHKCQIEVVPDCIGEMIHLRYLQLSHTFIMSLPESICGLKNMQTMKLRGCHKLQSLPEQMRKMSGLRHLDIQECNRLVSMPTEIGQLTGLKTLSVFIVGLESGCSIKELERLNIVGELKIKNLENVINSVDAKEVKLMRMENLRSLGLSWSHSQVQVNATEVIEGLKPCSNMRRLSIEGYEGATFPSWLTVSPLPKLAEISLSKCKCECLPPLWKLTHLRVLKMDSMDSVKFIDSEFYSEKQYPSLEKLILFRMPNLQRWSSSSQGGGQSAAQPVLFPRLKRPVLFPRLKRITLEELPKLTEIPLSSSLLDVHMTKCNRRVLRSLRDLNCLKTIEINEFDELVYFPVGTLRNLVSLKKLSIKSCKNLKTLPLEVKDLVKLTELTIESCAELVSLADGEGGLKKLSSLKSLVIESCLGLRCLPDLDKCSLVNLEISHCEELEFSVKDFKGLDVLQNLRLYRLPKLASFPVGILQATKLRTLFIKHCSEEDEMDLPDWMGDLTSLQKLHIEGCKHRKVLPDGLDLLTSFRSLVIEGCDAELERRCEKYEGEDWYKIADIPDVRISSRHH